MAVQVFLVPHRVLDHLAHSVALFIIAAPSRRMVVTVVQITVAAHPALVVVEDTVMAVMAVLVAVEETMVKLAQLVVADLVWEQAIGIAQ
jgi:hypothetical protein